MRKIPPKSFAVNQADAEGCEPSSTRPRQSQSNQIRRNYLRILRECKAQGKRFHRGNAKLRRKVNDEEARVQSELAPLKPPPKAENTANSMHRRQPRRTHHGKSTDPDDEADDPPDDYPAPSAWGQDPALDDGWDTPTPAICAQPAPAPCQQQDPQDPVPEYQAAPSGYPSAEVWPDTPIFRAVPEDTIEQWSVAKRWANEVAHDVRRFDAVLSHKIAMCQTWLRFKWTTDDKPTVFATRRCGKRICPICLLARSRSLRRRVDLFALELVGGEHGDLFATFSGRGDWEQYTEALQHLRQRRAWRKHISGAAFGRHISPSGAIHLHAYLEGQASPELLADWWRSAARSVGITHTRAHVEAVRNPPAAISYLLRPVQISGVSPEVLAEMPRQLSKKQTYAFTGTFREYWQEASKQAKSEKPPFKTNSDPLAYQWDIAGRTYYKTRFVLEDGP